MRQEDVPRRRQEALDIFKMKILISIIVYLLYMSGHSKQKDQNKRKTNVVPAHNGGHHSFLLPFLVEDLNAGIEEGTNLEALCCHFLHHCIRTLVGY